MGDYWRPAFDPEYREFLEKFLQEQEELPFEDPREFMRFCTDRLVTDIRTSQEDLTEAKQKLKELQEELEK